MAGEILTRPLTGGIWTLLVVAGCTGAIPALASFAVTILLLAQPKELYPHANIFLVLAAVGIPVSWSAHLRIYRLLCGPGRHDSDDRRSRRSKYTAILSGTTMIYSTLLLLLLALAQGMTR